MVDGTSSSTRSISTMDFNLLENMSSITTLSGNLLGGQNNAENDGGFLSFMTDLIQTFRGSLVL